MLEAGACVCEARSWLLTVLLRLPGNLREIDFTGFVRPRIASFLLV